LEKFAPICYHVHSISLEKIMIKFVLPYNMNTTVEHLAKAGYAPTFTDDEQDLGTINLNGENIGTVLRTRSFDVPVEVAAGKDIGLCGSDWVYEKEMELGLGLQVSASYSYGRKPQTVPTLDFIARQDYRYNSVGLAEPGTMFVGEYPLLITEELERAGRKVEQLGKNPDAPNNDPEMFREWCRERESVGLRIVHGRISALVADNPNTIGVMINESGATLRKKNLKKLDTIQEVKALLVVNPRSFQDPETKAEIEGIIKSLNEAYFRALAPEHEATPLIKESAELSLAGRVRRL
jgi:hypothetical protein